MIQALDRAARNASLRTPISIARAIRTSDEDPRLLDVDAFRVEERPTFYATLGRRLVLLGALDADVRQTVLRAILERTFVLGPRGMDAGAFAMAAFVGVKFDYRNGSAVAYRRRLENDKELRLSLAPMFDCLRSTRESDGGAEQ